MRICSWLVVWALVLVGRGWAAEAPGDVQFERDIVYGTAGGEPLKLNLARPKDATGAMPCILVIHGGAWRAGDRANHNNITWKLAQQGYVAATIGYRFCPKFPFPAQVQDVKCAVRFLRANAGKYNLDPGRMGATGYSAGAHLSMMLGTMDKEDGLDDSGGWEGQSSKVQAVVAFFGPTDLALDIPPVTQGLLRDFVGGSPEEKREAIRQASPIHYVSRGDAPMLLFQGTKDPLVPHSHAIAMLEAMNRSEVPGRLELMSGAGHGWGGTELMRTLAATIAFFDEQLKNAPPGGRP